MYYCYNLKNLYKEEEIYAKDLNMYLYYDEDNDEFYDKNGKVVSIYNKIIFVRSGVFHFKSLLMAVERHRGISITSLSDIEKIYRWPDYIQTKRKVFTLKVYEILNNQLYWEKLLSKNVIIKIKDKNVNFETNFKDIYEKSGETYRLLFRYKNDTMTISDSIPCLKDEYGALEYRVFVIGGKLLNISRKNDYFCDSLNSEVVLSAKEIILKFKQNSFSSNYALDIFVSERGIEIADCNPIEASASYAYNSVFLRNYDLDHSEFKPSIPKEKLLYDCSRINRDIESFETSFDDNMYIKTLSLK